MPEVQKSGARAGAGRPGGAACQRHLHRASRARHQIVAALSLEFEDRHDAPEIEACVERVETRVRAEMPQITALFVKPQTTGAWERRRKDLEAVAKAAKAGA